MSVSSKRYIPTMAHVSHFQTSSSENPSNRVALFSHCSADSRSSPRPPQTSHLQLLLLHLSIVEDLPHYLKAITEEEAHKNLLLWVGVVPELLTLWCAVLSYWWPEWTLIFGVTLRLIGLMLVSVSWENSSVQANAAAFTSSIATLLLSLPSRPSLSHLTLQMGTVWAEACSTILKVFVFDVKVFYLEKATALSQRDDVMAPLKLELLKCAIRVAIQKFEKVCQLLVAFFF